MSELTALDDFLGGDIEYDNPTPLPEKREIKFTVPKGIGEKTFRYIVGAAYTAYIACKGIPSVDEIYRYSDKRVSKSKISQITLTDEFSDAMEQRGIYWNIDRYSGLNPSQNFALAILTDPVNKNRTLQSKLKLAGITYSTYRAWLQQPTFARAMNNVTEGMLSDHAGDLHVITMNKALNGDLNAIKYIHELSGRHDPNRQQMVDVQVVVEKVIEIISQEVKDTETLTRIAARMKMVLAGQGDTVQGEISHA